MNCEAARRLIDAYMDSELDSTSAMEIEVHLSNCIGCSSMLESRQELSHAIKQAATYAPAPEKLRLQVRRRTGTKPRFRFGLATTALAFAVGIAMVLGVWQPWVSKPSLQDRILADVLSHHAEALTCSHFVDVSTKDPKLVQAWFTKKVDYSPRIPKTTDQGFTLIGGRIDNVAEHTSPVAAFMHGAHHIDVYITPSGESEYFDTTRHGLNVVSWNNCGLGYWVVSDDTMSNLFTLRQIFWGRRDH